jgi:hypothetical protein
LPGFIGGAREIQILDGKRVTAIAYDVDRVADGISGLSHPRSLLSEIV